MFFRPKSHSVLSYGKRWEICQQLGNLQSIENKNCQICLIEDKNLTKKNKLSHCIFR